jgi:acetyl-CoA acetyltransferase family protein
MTSPVYIVDAVRTPIGKIGGALARVRPDDLAADVISALVTRTPSLDPGRIDDVHFGNGNGAGEENRNVARMASLLAGLPTSVPGVTENRLCGSGLEALVAASREIAVGDADICIAGGVESMSRAPWVVQKPEVAFDRSHRQMHSTTLGWRMVNPRLPDQWTVALGEGAEILADEFEITRAAQDAFAARSHQLAAAAWSKGCFSDEVIPTTGASLVSDECIRPSTDQATLSNLKPVFREHGTVTAGNSSPMNDGAAGLLLASEAAVAELGVAPMARIVSRAVSGIEPHRFGVGPVEAVKRAMARAGLGWDDLDVVELNEAFAAQALACLKYWPELDPDRVNPNGGAIALGHPIGASGARIAVTLAHELRRQGGGYGLAAMCVGVGQGIALVVEGGSA